MRRDNLMEPKKERKYRIESYRKGKTIERRIWNERKQ